MQDFTGLQSLEAALSQKYIPVISYDINLPIPQTSDSLYVEPFTILTSLVYTRLPERVQC